MSHMVIGTWLMKIHCTGSRMMPPLRKEVARQAQCHESTQPNSCSWPWTTGEDARQAQRHQLSTPNLCPRKARPVAVIKENWVMDENIAIVEHFVTEEN